MTDKSTSRPLALVALIAGQILCAGFFLWDVAIDGLEAAWPPLNNPHFVIETLAALALIAAVAVEIHLLGKLLRREAHLQAQLSIAAGAFHDIMEARFADWQLTPSEADVATFTLKGMSIAEIAALRGTAEGTVKAQLGAIYRKAGVTGRGALLGLFVEDLMQTPQSTPPDGAGHATSG
ncbi:helix-turn-helix transcriptional regulator [Tropicibacter oceani]|uniref:Helix-turn-helix transcriptional regulator n=1 Tax=Tropicibacter oceani TaxID=3058420 RepID=A0ABY8QEF2_9RHOB|nr:helix-turn-helix transcriptional regulator [Tropicibacter oceani]WGW03011.1 helix-turn-helix transcriptional regulator [Tropicibacter oceani]